jgi:alpha-beta hydrolase superfamily lysophospholipase
LVRLVVGGRTPAEVYAARPDLQRIAPSHFSADQAYHRVARFYHQLERQELVRAWGRVACPVLALHGELDYISTLDDARAIANAAGESARAMALPGADHQMSDGGERLRLANGVRTATLEWLKSG